MNKLSSLAEPKLPGSGSKRPQFSWEDICMYLYGHKPVEPAVLEDQRKLFKKEENCQGNADVYFLALSVKLQKS